MGTAEIGDVARVEEDEEEEEEEERFEEAWETGRKSSRRKAKRAAKMEELAGVKEAKEGIFLPVDG